MVVGLHTAAMSTFATSTYVLRTHRPPAWRPLALALCCVAAYVVFLVLPFLLDQAHRLPGGAVGGALNDVHGGWPWSSTLGAVTWQVGGLLTLLAGPLVAGAAVVWAGAEWTRWQGRLTRTGQVLLAAAAVLGALVLLSLASPWGRGVLAWWLA